MSKQITKLAIFSSLVNTLILSQAFFLALYLRHIVALAIFNQITLPESATAFLVANTYIHHFDHK